MASTEENATPGHSALSITRSKLAAHLKWFIETYPIVEVQNNQAYHELLAVKAEIDFLKNKYDGLREQIEAEEPSLNEIMHYEIVGNFISIISKIKASLSSFENAQRKLNQAASVEPMAAQPRTVAAHHFQGFKLPEIPLPRFNGNFENWLDFRSAFSSIVANNDSVDDSVKFQYLKQVLSGEALNRVANVPSGDFKLAWDLLKERYDNPMLIADTHVAAILCPPALNPKSAQSWRTFIDHQKLNISALESLTLGIEIKDLLYMYVIISRFDAATLRDWERYNSMKDDLSLETLWTFMEAQHKVSQAVSLSFNHTSQGSQKLTSNQPARAPVQFKNNNNSNTAPTFSKSSACLFCNDSTHNVFNCSILSKIAPAARYEAVKKKRLCFNCLRPFTLGHICSGACKHCGKAHHTLLHGATPSNSQSSGKGGANSNSIHTHIVKSTTGCCSCSGMPTTNTISQLSLNSVDQSCSQSSSCSPSEPKDISNHNMNSSVSSLSPSSDVQVVNNSNCASITDRNAGSLISIMPTAEVVIFDNLGQPVPCRALLDTGSDACFISKDLAARLALPAVRKDSIIHTVSGTNSGPILAYSIPVHSSDRTWSKNVECLIVNKITPSILSCGINVKNLNIPANIKLADPNFFQSQGVDILLSVSVYASTVVFGQIPLAPECILQNTTLGWVIWGAMKSNQPPHSVQNFQSNFVSVCEISNQLERFWKLEEIITDVTKPPKYIEVEKHYATNVKRHDDGRFSVALPKKDSFHALGQSRFQALNRFHSLERRLSANTDLKEGYVAFMEEYQLLGHMSPVPPPEPTEKCYYIPHHPIFKPDSTTTKLRVVFDASAKSSTGVSLNEVLHAGHTVQPELFEIVLRFRTHHIAFIADITKMYRQILVHPDDRNLQRIFWRSDVNQPIQEFVLNTVSYGTTPAAFLATRTLNHLADLESAPDSQVSIAIKNDFYVDDLISGCSTTSEATILAQQLLTTLAKGGFELRKWLSNSSELLATIPSHLVESVTSKPLSDSNDSVVKALGLIWNSTLDVLLISSSVADVLHKTSFTKRELLSCISSIFDPLGLISPVVILPKMLFQKLWLLKIDWDQKLPQDLLEEWLKILHELPNIANISVPRCVLPQDCNSSLELHGFADASVAAYGACLYVRSVSPDGVQVRLFTSKSKLASLNPLLSIPRLELQAALLLTRLVNKVICSSKLSFSGVYLWTDSKIVCDWLKSPPNRSDVFVSVRISEIQNTTSNFCWNHVRTACNPADLVSRGCAPNTLINSSLWWNGPSWLLKPSSTWNEFSSNVVISGPVSALVTCSTPSIFSDIISKCSTYHKMVRTTAYVLRFAHNLSHHSDPNFRLAGPLSVQEIQAAELKLFKSIQNDAFSNDLKALNQHKELPSNSSLKALSPFIDSDSLLRVGGRLQEANASFDYKHQILLPPKHKFTRALIVSYHRRLQHAGVQVTMANIRQRFWIPSTRRTVKSVLKACKMCFRFSAHRAEQIMGHLPAVRIQADYPFYNSGIDYAGPFSIRIGGPKSRTFSKAYLALFVCMVTRAVHVEVVSELSTKNFIAALIRFSARRGIPHSIYSDNATTFVGANNELHELYNFLSSSKAQAEIQSFASVFNISWHFIPPRAPHFGGLWENAVKNFKRIFRVVTLNKILNFEEISTLSTQIEAILNSRPLIPLSEDPQDLSYLSPGHFLIGRPLTALPFQTPGTTHVDHRSRWRQLAATAQELWDRWHQEYLVTLQKRSKWTSTAENLKIGAIVILKDPGTSPSAWKLARITEVHPGNDGKVRVVTVLTPAGTYKRAISSIAPLPQDEDSD